MANLRSIARPLGLMWGMVVCALVLPAATGWLAGDGTGGPFAWTALAGAGAAGAMLHWSRGAPPASKRSAFALIGLGAGSIVVLSALPYWLWELRWVDALFESMSGWTTTGATILSNLQERPASVLLWRALTQWMGGLGVLFMVLILLPYVESERTALLGIGVGDRYKPRMRDVGRDLFWFYLLASGLHAVLLYLGGVEPLDSVCLAMCTLSTGGFTTGPAALPAGAGLYVELVTVLFMLAGATNFLLHIRIFQGTAFAHARSELFRIFIWLILLASGAAALDAALHNPGTGFWTAWRRSVFETVSFATTTGFRGTAEPAFWSDRATAGFFLLTFVGGMVGSTSGGIRVQRWVIVARAALREIGRLLRPNRVEQVWVEGRMLPPDLVNRLVLLVVVWLGLFASGTLILLAHDAEMGEALFASAAALNNVGASIDPAEGAWGRLDDVAKLSMAALMLIGRLEFFTLIAFLSPSAWRVEPSGGSA